MSVAAGCGGGGDSAPTKAEFVEEANAICIQGEKNRSAKLQSLTREYGSLPAKSIQEKGIVELAGVYEATIRELAALEPPAGDGATVKKIIEAMEDSAQKVKQDPGTALTGTVQFKQANERAQAYGLTKCMV